MRGIFINSARRALFTAATKLPVRTYLDTRIRFRDWDNFLDFNSALRFKNAAKRSFRPGLLDFYIPTINKSI